LSDLIFKDHKRPLKRLEPKKTKAEAKEKDVKTPFTKKNAI